MESVRNIYWLLGLVLCLGCENETVQSPQNNWNQFIPLAESNSWEYSVERTTYSLDGSIRDTLLIVKDSIIKLESKQGELDYTIYRYSKNNSSSWDHTYSYRLINKGDELIFGGETTLLLFKNPVAESVSWNRNMYNSDLPEISSYSSLKQFDNSDFQTLIISHNNNQDFVVNLKEDIGEYQEGVGLVNRSYKDFTYCLDDLCRGTQEIVEGVEEKWVLLKSEIN